MLFLKMTLCKVKKHAISNGSFGLKLRRNRGTRRRNLLLVAESAESHYSRNVSAALNIRANALHDVTGTCELRQSKTCILGTLRYLTLTFCTSALQHQPSESELQLYS